MATFPEGDYDLPDKLLSLTGSFWDEVFRGNHLVRGVLHARARLEYQTWLDTRELYAARSRLATPDLHLRNWLPLTLREADRDSGAAGRLRFDGAAAFDGGYAFDQVVGGASHGWPLPDGVAGFPALCNRLTDSSLVWVRGVDYECGGGAVVFRRDPFSEPLLTPDDGDGGREVTLWAYHAGLDRRTVYRQFGYVLGVEGPSTPAYKAMVNGLFDALVQGSTAAAVEAGLSAACGVPLAAGDEVVELVDGLGPDLWVVTDRNAYRFRKGSTPLVAAGDRVRAGDPLADGLVLHDFRGGVPPAPADLPALALGSDFLGGRYAHELVFENKDVPLELSYDADGYARVSFEVGGVPGDVAAFWDDVHARGRASGTTLAMLLDARPAPSGQPAAMNLPASVNPLGFLAANVFRGNLTVAAVRPALFGRDALGLHHAAALRAAVPPHTALLLAVRLDAGPDTITMDGPGDESSAGYEEAVSVFSGQSAAETVDPGYVTERVVLRQTRGRCE